MLKETAYYEGRDLSYPARPAKPRLMKPDDATAVRAYADELDAYNVATITANAARATYNDLMKGRSDELMADLATEYGLSPAKVSVLYSKAYSDYHSGGLGEVINAFDDLVDLVNEFNSAE